MPKVLTEEAKLKERANTWGPWKHVRWWLPRHRGDYMYYGHCVTRDRYNSLGHVDKACCQVLTIEEFTEAKLKLGRDP